MGHARGKTPSLADRISAGVKVGVHQEGSAVLDRIARLDSPVVQGTTSRPARSLIDAAQHPGADPVVLASEATDFGPEALEGTPGFVAWVKATGYKPGSILKLSLDLLDDNPCNPRRFYLQESIDRLAINLSNIGQQSPIQVGIQQDASGRFTIIEGHRRVRALRKLGRETVKAIVVDKSEALDLYKLAFDLNTQRDSQTIFDNAMAWRQLLMEGRVPNQQALASFLGIDETTVSMTLSIAQLPEEVLREMVRHVEHFGLNTSYHIQRYCREKGAGATLKLVERVRLEGLSMRAVAALVRDGEGAPGVERTTRARYNQRFEVKHHTRRGGYVKVYGEDRLEMSLRGLPLEKRDEIYAKLKDLLAGI
jgi:ParB family transcriptional regulator, chromosome partitioning protein